MKKYFLVITLILSTLFSPAQQSFFDKFETHEEVLSVTVDQEMLSLIGALGTQFNEAEAKMFAKVINKMTSLKLMSTKSNQVAKEIKTTIAKYLNTKGLYEISNIKSGNQSVNVYVREGKREDYIEEILMFVSDSNMLKNQLSSEESNKQKPESMLLIIKGNINLKELVMIAEQMNVPGTQQLKKAIQN